MKICLTRQRCRARSKRACKSSPTTAPNSILGISTSTFRPSSAPSPSINRNMIWRGWARWSPPTAGAFPKAAQRASVYGRRRPSALPRYLGDLVAYPTGDRETRMAGKRIVAAKIGKGMLDLVEEDIPPVVPGAVLVQVKASLVSPGSEVGGWRQLREDAASPARWERPIRFGYANAGVVAEVGPGVVDLQVGDKVACMGEGFAQHTDCAV